MIPIKSSSRGLSLIELLVVLALLTTLSVLAIPMMGMMEVRARERLLRDALRETRLALDRYRAARSPLSGGSMYPPCIASLCEVIPPSLLRKGSPNAGPFLVAPPVNPFVGNLGVFTWDLRDEQDPAGVWQADVSDPRQVLPNGVFDIRVPVSRMGDWQVAIDGSLYVDW
ncbi:MAG: prepilin-type N-terminal cleavage/methylation domain-containing protein [Candidatus Ozemobacteraceae bacterium]